MTRGVARTQTRRGVHDYDCTAAEAGFCVFVSLPATLQGKDQRGGSPHVHAPEAGDRRVPVFNRM
jgi:hypothetical protein